MVIAIASAITIGVLLFILSVRAKNLPESEPESPFHHLDDRKAAIYENLRDLQFEYRLGKLSDVDYQATKRDLQKELAAVLAEVDKLKLQLAPPAPVVAAAAKPQAAAHAVNGNGAANVCPSCGAKFEKALKFCGECGKAMKVAQS